MNIEQKAIKEFKEKFVKDINGDGSDLYVMAFPKEVIAFIKRYLRLARDEGWYERDKLQEIYRKIEKIKGI